MRFASSCRAVARSKVTFFIGRCRLTRTLSLKDRRDGLRIQRTHRRASTPKARRKKTWLQPRYRPSTPSWRMGRRTRLRTDFATQPDVAASWARSRRRAGAPQKRRGRANACAIRRGGPSTCRSDRRLSPEVLKSIRRKFGVTHRVLDVLVAEPGL